MDHSKIIAQMLKERMESKNKDDLNNNLDESLNFNSAIDLKEDNNFDNNSVQQEDLDVSNEETSEMSERQRRMLERLESKMGTESEKMCPICGSKLINKGNGILQCEKITCYYSENPKPKFKSKLSDSEIYQRSFWG